MAQELKVTDLFEDDFKKAGYTIQGIGQKAYNGVAVISKDPVSLISDKLAGDESDEQARYLEFDWQGLRCINIYAPNGNPRPGDKYDYKLSWMERLLERLRVLRAEKAPFFVAGDFNVIPEAEDCHDPKAWEDDALYVLQTRQAYRKILHLGLTDALRVSQPHDEAYTFWDYQAGAWPKNNGIRIDHFLLSPALADRLEHCAVNKTPRGWEKPSDHTAVELVLA